MNAEGRPDQSAPQPYTDTQSVRPGPRVRTLRRVVIRTDQDGCLASAAVRRACDHVLPGDDVVVVVRGRLSAPDPGVAGLLGRALAEARTVSVEGVGPWIGMFADTLREAAELEALEAATW